MASLFGFLILAAMAVAGLAANVFWMAILIGLIPAAIASSKGARSFLGWWGFGAALFIVALPMALVRRNEKQEEMRKLVASIAANTERRDAPTAPRGGGRHEDDDDVFETGGRPGEYSSWVAGLVHRPTETRQAVRDVRSGEILVLKRDPYHPADPRAVEIYWRGRHVGYVPARHVAWVSERMDTGKPISAFVEDVERAAGGEVSRIGTSLRLVALP